VIEVGFGESPGQTAEFVAGHAFAQPTHRAISKLFDIALATAEVAD
jgi:hypothetical protein